MYKNVTLIFFLAITIFFSTFAFSQNNLIPKNPKITDTSLQKFLTEFIDAVKTKNKTFIIDNLSDTVNLSFDGKTGVEAFKKQWKWSEDSNLFWLVANKIIQLGGGDYQNDNYYALPYVFSNWPENEDIDPYTHMVITGTKVNVRSEPNINNSEVVGQLNFDIVSVDFEKSSYKNNHASTLQSNFTGDSDWYFIETLDKKIKGYVFWDLIWSPIGYRIGFEKINNQWKISFVITGD